MTSRGHWFVWPSRLLVVVGAAFLALATAADAETTGPATERLRHFFAAANQILEDPATAYRPLEKLAAIKRLVSEIGDWETASARVLGPEWRLRGPAERDEFSRLFGDLLQRTFVAVMASRARVEGGTSVTWQGERGEGDEAVVASMVEGRGGTTFPVIYRMGRAGGQWRVRDVVFEGVSLVENYRAQVVTILRRSSYQQLVGEMRSLVSEPVVAASAVAPALSPVFASATSMGLGLPYGSAPAPALPIVALAPTVSGRVTAPAERPALAPTESAQSPATAAPKPVLTARPLVSEAQAPVVVPPAPDRTAGPVAPETQVAAVAAPAPVPTSRPMAVETRAAVVVPPAGNPPAGPVAVEPQGSTAVMFAPVSTARPLAAEAQAPPAVALAAVPTAPPLPSEAQALAAPAPTPALTARPLPSGSQGPIPVAPAPAPTDRPSMSEVERAARREDAPVAERRAVELVPVGVIDQIALAALAPPHGAPAPDPIVAPIVVAAVQSAGTVAQRAEVPATEPGRYLGLLGVPAPSAAEPAAPTASPTPVLPSGYTLIAALPPASPPQEPSRVTPEAIPAPPSAPVAAEPARRPRSYWVQVGWFRDPQAAARLAERLSAWAPASVTGPLARGQGPTSELPARVVMGPFADRAEAVAAIKRLGMSGMSGFITEQRD